METNLLSDDLHLTFSILFGLCGRDEVRLRESEMLHFLRENPDGIGTIRKVWEGKIRLEKLSEGDLRFFSRLKQFYPQSTSLDLQNIVTEFLIKKRLPCNHLWKQGLATKQGAPTQICQKCHEEQEIPMYVRGTTGNLPSPNGFLTLERLKQIIQEENA